MYPYKEKHNKIQAKDIKFLRNTEGRKREGTKLKTKILKR
jgi:hypothetical protein